MSAPQRPLRKPAYAIPLVIGASLFVALNGRCCQVDVSSDHNGSPAFLEKFGELGDPLPLFCSDPLRE